MVIPEFVRVVLQRGELLSNVRLAPARKSEEF